MVRHFLSQSDLAPEEVRELFVRAAVLKPPRYSTALLGRTLVMFFEKTSTRTRLSFEIGMTQLGGHAIFMDRDASQLSRGESLEDTARVVSRYADLMMARVNCHQTVQGLAANSSIPVINGLSDWEHPCQSLTDLFTVYEKMGRVEGIRIAYVGDGNNNVTHSLMLGAAGLGAHLHVASPSSLMPAEAIADCSRRAAAASGGSVTISDDAHAAVRGAQVIYTDTWVSMGREADAESRRDLLHPYQVNGDLVEEASTDYIFMHCLPAHVGDEVTAEIAYGSHSVIFDQAENRLHVQKALMLYLCESKELAA